MSSIHDADRAIQPVECPECNTHPNVLQAGPHFSVRCPNCGASAGCTDCTAEEAIATWNRAVAQIVVPEDLEWDSVVSGDFNE